MFIIEKVKLSHFGDAHHPVHQRIIFKAADLHATVLAMSFSNKY